MVLQVFEGLRIRMMEENDESLFGSRVTFEGFHLRPDTGSRRFYIQTS